MRLRSHTELTVCTNKDSQEANIVQKGRESDPQSYDEAIRSNNADSWLAAMNDEMDSMRKHKVWELSELPDGVTPVKCKWVLRTKNDLVGEVKRFKARLVAKGFTQQKGTDYEEIYAPVSSFETMRILTALGVEENWLLDHHDIKGAYLHSELHETIYMEQPEGFAQPNEKHLYCKLNKAIYGLKQSGRCWNKHLDHRLREAGFKRNPVDPCIYMLTLQEGIVIISVYVDDIYSASQNELVRNKCKELISSLFDSTYLGQVSYLLGVRFEQRDDGSVTLNQSSYIESILTRFGLENAKEISTPMEEKFSFQDVADNGDDNHESLPYKELIGSLLYLAQRTRPDISYAVGRLARYSSCFSKEHWNAAIRVLRYLKATKDAGIIYRKTGEPLLAYADADWATCAEDRKSTTGYAIILAGGPVVWRSVKQSVTALSTMEAEYVATSECAREVTWIRELIIQLNLQRHLTESTIIMCDSQAAIAHANNYIDKARTKHISIRHHFLREKIQDESVKLRYISSDKNLADIMTKPLGRRLFETHRNVLMDMRSNPTNEEYDRFEGEIVGINVLSQVCG